MKTRRQSVQHGIHVIREMEEAQGQQREVSPRGRPVLGVVFDDISEDSSENDDDVTRKASVVEKTATANKEPQTRRHNATVMGQSIYDVDVSDDEEDIERVKVARARGTIHGPGLRGRSSFVDVASSSRQPYCDTAKDIGPGVVNMKDLFAMDISDDSDDAEDRSPYGGLAAPLEVREAGSAGTLELEDIEDGEVLSDAEIEADIVIRQSSAKATPKFQNMTMSQLLSMEVSSDSSDFSNQ
jgi:hypothetical protein